MLSHQGVALFEKNIQGSEGVALKEVCHHRGGGDTEVSKTHTRPSGFPCLPVDGDVKSQLLLQLSVCHHTPPPRQ